MSNLSNKLNQAILKSLAGKYSLYIFQIISLAILSRLYTPQMFGVLAAVTVLILFFQLIATSGLGPAVIYAKSISIDQRDGIFTASFIIGTVGALLFYIFTPYLMGWLEIENLSYINLVLAFNILFSALSMLPLASLQKDTQFLLIARAEILAELLSLAVAVVMYYQGFGVLGLISKLMVVPVIRFVFYHFSSTKSSIGKAHFGKDIKAICTLFAVAKYQLAFNILNFFSRNLDTILITKYFGAVAVGFYEKSYQVMRYPLQLFTFAITPALQPILTEHKDNPFIVMKEFYRIAIKLACLGLFTSMVLYWSAADIVLILFGPQWESTVYILKVLSVTIPLQMVLSATGGIFQAFGATKEMFYCGLFSSSANVCAIVLGVLSGDLLTLCTFLAVSFALNYLQCFYVLHKYLFKSYPIKQFLILTTLIITCYLNLLDNATLNDALGIDYFDAFLNCLITSLIFFTIVTLLFLTISRLGLLEVRPSNKD